MAKDLQVALLLDYYGALLTDKQRDFISLYYDEDLSLSEIAENSGITRQGVHDNIKRAAAELKAYEEKLGLFARFSDITSSAGKIKVLLSEELDSDSTLYKKVIKLLDTIVDEA